MKYIISIIILVFVVTALNGCALTNRKIIAEGPNDHGHMRPNMKVIGDYHTQLLVDHNKGKMELNIYNDVEEPSKIKAERIIGLMTLPDGTEKEIIFEPKTDLGMMSPDYRNRQRRYGVADSYVAWIDEIKNIHSFDIKFIIPIDLDKYEVAFNYKTKDKENSHHVHS